MKNLNIDGENVINVIGNLNVNRRNIINTIRNLPDLIMEDSGIILPWKSTDIDEMKFLSSAREFHRSQADWLEYYLNDRTDLLIELNLTRKFNFKLVAERTLSYHRLIQEVYQKSDIAKENNLEPLKWLAVIEVCHCLNKLKYSYYDSIDNHIGKAASYKSAKKHYDFLENEVSKSTFTTIPIFNKCEKSKNRFRKLNPHQLLEYEAIKIALSNIEFRNSYFQNYIKEQKRFYAKLRDSPLQYTYINQKGELITISNGVRGKATKQKAHGFK